LAAVDSFLREQLKRIHELTERMARLDQQTAELTADIKRNRAVMQQSPLHEVRDYRTYTSQRSSEPARRHEDEADRPSIRRRRRRR
jgi:hypothetical protein